MYKETLVTPALKLAALRSHVFALEHVLRHYADKLQLVSFIEAWFTCRDCSSLLSCNYDDDDGDDDDDDDDIGYREACTMKSKNRRTDTTLDQRPAMSP
jgi:hypothetical protein